MLNDASTKRTLEAELDTRLHEDARKARADQYTREENMREAVSLYAGVLTKQYPGLNGPLMLNGARLGAEVDVLEEDVGADGSYLTVRDKLTGRSGFYPKAWVARKDASSDGSDGSDGSGQ